MQEERIYKVLIAKYLFMQVDRNLTGKVTKWMKCYIKAQSTNISWEIGAF